jgi:predicted alpha/beta-hydrolase family hydrolase
MIEVGEQPGTLLVFPGAGTSSTHPSLVRLAAAVVPWACVRADFPYRKAGRRAPDRPPKLIAAVRQELAAIDGPVVMGGRSMGGRMCSMVAAGADGEPTPADLVGLVLIAYPLHPPGKPDALRTEHLPLIEVPTLFISGTRDPFATPDELRTWSATIPGEVTHVFVEGKGHDLKGADDDIADATVTWLAAVRDRAG